MKLTTVVPVLLSVALLSLAACDTAPATPTGEGLRVLSFTVTPNPVERGGRVTVTWDVAGASRVTLWRMQYASRVDVSTVSRSIMPGLRFYPPLKDGAQ